MRILPEVKLERAEKQHIKAAKVIHNLNKSIKDENVQEAFNWQDLGYIHKRKIELGNI